eukprot:gene1496-439_t
MPALKLALLPVLAAGQSLPSPNASKVTGLGDRVVRGYSVYENFPITTEAARADGWTPRGDGACSPGLGIEWEQSGGVRNSHPITMFFTPAGQAVCNISRPLHPNDPNGLQVAGIQTQVYGDLKAKPIEQGYYRRVANDQYSVSVTFRAPTGDASVCSTAISPDALGDRAVINADTIAHALPMTAKTAASANWT